MSTLKWESLPKPHEVLLGECCLAKGSGVLLADES